MIMIMILIWNKMINEISQMIGRAPEARQQTPAKIMEEQFTPSVTGVSGGRPAFSLFQLYRCMTLSLDMVVYAVRILILLDTTWQLQFDMLRLRLWHYTFIYDGDGRSRMGQHFAPQRIYQQLHCNNMLSVSCLVSTVCWGMWNCEMRNASTLRFQLHCSWSRKRHIWVMIWS